MKQHTRNEIIFALLLAISLLVLLPYNIKPVSATLAVQTTTCNVGSGTKVTCTFGSMPTAGNLLAVGIVAAGVTVSSVTETGTTWNQAVAVIENSYHVELWYAYNTAASSKQVNITIASGSAVSGIAAEYSGFGVLDPLDKTATYASAADGGVCQSGTTAKMTALGEIEFAPLFSFSATLTVPTRGFTISVSDTTSEGYKFYMADNSSLTQSTAQVATTATGGTYCGGTIATFIKSYSQTQTTTSVVSSTVSYIYLSQTATATLTTTKTNTTITNVSTSTYLIVQPTTLSYTLTQTVSYLPLGLNFTIYTNPAVNNVLFTVNGNNLALTRNGFTTFTIPSSAATYSILLVNTTVLHNSLTYTFNQWGGNGVGNSNPINVDASGYTNINLIAKDRKSVV
jgi:hypothetical protein